MSEVQNPYQAPAAELSSTEYNGELAVHEAQMVGIGRGASWLFDGFAYFKSDVGNWIGLLVVGFVLMIVLSIIPIVNIFMGFLGSVWMGGLMLGCKSIHDGNGLQVGHLFAGFKNRFGSLLGLSVIAILAVWGVMALTLGSLFLPLITGDTEQFLANPTQILMGLLLAFAIIIPLYMAVWFAPCLILFGNKGIFTALKMSFVGCLKNFLPFFVYGIVGMLLMIVASIPLGLGLLVVMPMFFASIFISFKEIYVD